MLLHVFGARPAIFVWEVHIPNFGHFRYLQFGAVAPDFFYFFGSGRGKGSPRRREAGGFDF